MITSCIPEDAHRHSRRRVCCPHARTGALTGQAWGASLPVLRARIQMGTARSSQPPSLIPLPPFSARHPHLYVGARHTPHSMSGRPRTEATDVASAFDQSKVNQVNYVQSSDPNDPNMVYLPGSSGPINLKPAKYDAQTFETPWAKLVRKCKQQPAVPICAFPVYSALHLCVFLEARPPETAPSHWGDVLRDCVLT